MDILFSEEKKIGTIVLNRPSALNALTYEMLALLESHLIKWEESPLIDMVVITSSNDKAFSAGIDLKTFYQNGLANWQNSYALAELEYRLNRRIFHYKKPYIAIMHGIVMGGGVGISLHGSHPIATDTMRFALPEVRIGFFPDVGSSYFLPRLPHKVGWYLAMTGNTITAFDALTIGLVKHVIQADKQKEVLSSLPDRLEEALFLYQSPYKPSQLDLKKIEHAFSKKSVEEIVKAFGPENFKGKSQESIAIAFKQMQKGLTLSFDEAIDYELSLAKDRLQSSDLYEGIYYRLIEKRENPKW